MTNRLIEAYEWKSNDGTEDHWIITSNSNPIMRCVDEAKAREAIEALPSLIEEIALARNSGKDVEIFADRLAALGGVWTKENGPKKPGFVCGGIVSWHRVRPTTVH